MRYKTWEIQEQTDAAPHYPVDVDIYYQDSVVSMDTRSSIWIDDRRRTYHTTAYY
jgi:hypothetical protein